MYLHLGTYHSLLWHLPNSSQAQLLFVEQFVICLLVQYFHLKSKEIKENQRNEKEIEKEFDSIIDRNKLSP